MARVLLQYKMYGRIWVEDAPEDVLTCPDKAHEYAEAYVFSMNQSRALNGIEDGDPPSAWAVEVENESGGLDVLWEG